jgi:hypothetical protein
MTDICEDCKWSEPCIGTEKLFCEEYIDYVDRGDEACDYFERRKEEDK